MSEIKTYTDLSQSKKLAEILPLESADMRYGYIAPYDHSDRMYDGGYDEIPYHKDFLIKNPDFSANEYDAELPCWSLTALISVLRIFTTPTAFSVNVSTPSLTKTENGYKLTYTGDYTPMIKNELSVETPIESTGDNAIDACYKMILKLHELNLL